MPTIPLLSVPNSIPKIERQEKKHQKVVVGTILNLITRCKDELCVILLNIMFIFFVVVLFFIWMLFVENRKFIEKYGNVVPCELIGENHVSMTADREESTISVGSSPNSLPSRRQARTSSTRPNNIPLYDTANIFRENISPISFNTYSNSKKKDTSSRLSIINTLSTIGLGSCNSHDLPQDYWKLVWDIMVWEAGRGYHEGNEVINPAMDSTRNQISSEYLSPSPDLFIWLGDVVYIDSTMRKFNIRGGILEAARLAYGEMLRNGSYYREFMDKMMRGQESSQPNNIHLTSTGSESKQDESSVKRRSPLKRLEVREYYDSDSVIVSNRVVGVWDDHDMGENDGGLHFKYSAATQEYFLDFLGVPRPPGQESLSIHPLLQQNQQVTSGVRSSTSHPRRRRVGTYGFYTISAAPAIADSYIHSFCILLLDVRTFREDPMPYKDSDILGEDQWLWLDGVLSHNISDNRHDYTSNKSNVPNEKNKNKRKCAATLIGTGIQFISNEKPSEKWGNFEESRKRLIRMLRKYDINRLVFLSGDIHMTELFKDYSKTVAGDDELGYPMVDFTTSGLTHSSSSSFVQYLLLSAVYVSEFVDTVFTWLFKIVFPMWNTLYYGVSFLFFSYSSSEQPYSFFDFVHDDVAVYSSIFESVPISHVPPELGGTYMKNSPTGYLGEGKDPQGNEKLNIQQTYRRGEVGVKTTECLDSQTTNGKENRISIISHLGDYIYERIFPSLGNSRVAHYRGKNVGVVSLMIISSKMETSSNNVSEINDDKGSVSLEANSSDPHVPNGSMHYNDDEYELYLRIGAYAISLEERSSANFKEIREQKCQPWRYNPNHAEVAKNTILGRKRSSPNIGMRLYTKECNVGDEFGKNHEKTLCSSYSYADRHRVMEYWQPLAELESTESSREGYTTNVLSDSNDKIGALPESTFSFDFGSLFSLLSTLLYDNYATHTEPLIIRLMYYLRCNGLLSGLSTAVIWSLLLILIISVCLRYFCYYVNVILWFIVKLQRAH